MEHNAQLAQKVRFMEHNTQQSKYSTSRRSFLRRGFAAAGAGTVGAGLFANGFNVLPAFAKERSGGITKGDVAILRLLAAIEIIESDLWQQYNELGGIQDSEVPGGSGSAATSLPFKYWMGTCPSISTIILRMSSATWPSSTRSWLQWAPNQSIWISFARCPAAKPPVPSKLDGSPTSCSSRWTPSWWARYRSRTQNPDFGNTFPQAIPGLSKGKFPAIPRNDGDLAPNNHHPGHCHTAGFHFGFIEVGGSSLYPTLAQGVTNLEVLRILLSIGPVETSQLSEPGTTRLAMRLL